MYNLNVLPDFAITPSTEKTADEADVNNIKVEVVEIAETPVEVPQRRGQFNGKTVRQKWREGGWGN